MVVATFAAIILEFRRAKTAAALETAARTNKFDWRLPALHVI